MTRRVPEERAEEVWAFVRKQVSSGQQAYMVYPVIEGAKDDQPELDFAPMRRTRIRPPRSLLPGQRVRIIPQRSARDQSKIWVGIKLRSRYA